MLSPLIHIGYPKTGSTWLQTCLFKQCADIKYIGPQVARDTILSDNNQVFNPYELRKKITDSVGKNRLIISDPELAGVIRFDWNNGKYGEEIAVRLNKLFPKAQIVIFIRNQVDFLISAYVYYIRKGGTYSSGKFFDDIINNGKLFSISLKYLEYHILIDMYKELFGNEKIHVYLYEDFSNNPKDFISQFCKTHQLIPQSENIDFSKRNARLRTGLMNFMRFTNKFNNGDTPVKKNYINLPFLYTLINCRFEKYNKYRIFGKPKEMSDFFKQSDIQQFQDHYRKSNNELIKAHKMETIKKYNYPI